MILQKEKIRDYKKKRDNFVNQIKNNFDTFYDDKHDDLNSIIKFINYSDSFLAELLEAQNLNESAQNLTKADKWLVNALVLVVRDSNTFNGTMFINGKKKVLKAKILKS